MWKPHQSESLHILLRHTGQTGPSLVLILIVILASLLTLNPARAPPPPPKIHAPIVIDGNGGFTEQNGVTSGNGTASNPYVIEGWNITTDGTTGVTISNTDAYFMIRNVGIETNAAFLWTQPGVNITSVANANVESTTNGRDHYSERSSIAVVSSENLIVDNDIASVVSVVHSYRVQVSNNDAEYISVDSSSLVSVLTNHGPFGRILVVSSSYVTVSGNIGARCDCIGVFVTSSDRVEVSDNRLEGDRGVYVVGSASVKISDNQISDGTDGGIILDSCSNIFIQNNSLRVISDPSYGAIGVTKCDNVTISENHLARDPENTGPVNLVKISLSGDITIEGNSLSHSTGAITISDTTIASIVNNNIQFNRQGLTLNNTDNIHVFHNNFLNNTIQASDTYSTQNAWDNDYPSGGNFWSNAVGVDYCSGPQQNICPNPDGMGDAPYTFNDNQDHYPLMKPFASRVVATAKYDPSVISLSSLGRYLTVSIQLLTGFNVSNVVLSSIRLNGTIAPASGVHATAVSLKGAQVLMVKFSMTEVKTLFTKPGDYSLYLSGNIVNSVAFRPFVAATVIRVQSG